MIKEVVNKGNSQKGDVLVIPREPSGGMMLG